MSENNKDDRVVALRRGSGKCPICGRPQIAEHRPFCSRRCADQDLARWLGGAYRVETNETPETEQAPDEPS
jgi:uncharacterized protein